MEFVCYTDWQRLPESANALFAQACKESVFFSRPWFENLTNTVLEKNQSLLLASVIQDQEVLALLPLKKQGDLNLTGLTHLYSSLFSLLLSPQNQQATLECLVRGFEQVPITSLRLDPVAEDDQNMQMLQQVMQTMGYECHRRFRFYNWIHRVQGQSFDDYMATRPSRVRNTITRKQRKLERELGFTIKLYSDRDLEQGLADYNAVYRKSWKAHEQFDDFIEGLARTFSEPGWLRLAVLYIGEKPAAAQFWFVAHGKASIFKLVYDEAWKHYSPGTILISYLMQYVIEKDQVGEIDFLTGNDTYKQDWMSERRQRWTLSFFKHRKPKNLAQRLIEPLKTRFLHN